MRGAESDSDASEIGTNERASLMAAYGGRRVLITGHTGFKGAWLSLWLSQLGAQVFGLAHPPEEKTLFVQAGISNIIVGTYADVRDREGVEAVLRDVRPDIVFHLAAQSLVSRGYASPLETFGTNVMGTAHVLEAVRSLSSQTAVIVVTSDKCYRNEESVWPFREIDPLGGEDPYSSSKACAELVAAAYRSSFSSSPEGPLIATVRAGNVIGGGDWSDDRLMPDIATALITGRPALLRNPSSIRPWQHVLEPLRGYLTLGARLLAGEAAYADAWNFGPQDDDIRSVQEVAKLAVQAWGSGSIEVRTDDGYLREARTLRLDSSKSRQLLGYRPQLSLEEAVELTVAWYKAYDQPVADLRAFTQGQISSYTKLLGDD